MERTIAGKALLAGSPQQKFKILPVYRGCSTQPHKKAECTALTKPGGIRLLALSNSSGVKRLNFPLLGVLLRSLTSPIRHGKAPTTPRFPAAPALPLLPTDLGERGLTSFDLALLEPLSSHIRTKSMCFRLPQGGIGENWLSRGHPVVC